MGLVEIGNGIVFPKGDYGHLELWSPGQDKFFSHQNPPSFQVSVPKIQILPILPKDPTETLHGIEGKTKTAP